MGNYENNASISPVKDFQRSNALMKKSRAHSKCTVSESAYLYHVVLFLRLINIRAGTTHNCEQSVV